MAGMHGGNWAALSCHISRRVPGAVGCLLAACTSTRWMSPDEHGIRGRLEPQTETDVHAAVVVDEQREPGLTDGTGIRADDDFQRAMVHLDPLQNPRRQLLWRGGCVAAVGDLPAPALSVDFPRIKLADPPGDGPAEGRLTRYRNRLGGRPWSAGTCHRFPLRWNRFSWRHPLSACGEEGERRKVAPPRNESGDKSPHSKAPSPRWRRIAGPPRACVERAVLSAGRRA